MHSTYLAPAFILLGASAIQASIIAQRSVLDGPCSGAGGAPGVCIATAECTSDGGSFITGACPGLPNDIKCCTRTSCGSGGNCRFTSDCDTGNIVSNLCPGPTGFKCCLPKSSGGNGGGSGGFGPPNIPSVGACKAVAVSGAEQVVATFPGEVREIGCIRDGPCPGDSDHNCGKAIDYMCSSAAGVRTDSGEAIAEWMMNNRGSLDLKYVIWGQKIWNPSRDVVQPWSGWRLMEDRGDNTANHWDHVHASFN